MAQIQLQSAQAAGAINRQAEDDADLQRALEPVTGLDDNRSGGISISGSIRKLQKEGMKWILVF
jgi:hypothetical protein